MDPFSKEFDDAVVVSGVSVRVPNAASVQEFADNLYAKADCTSSPQLRYGNNVHPDVPHRMGLLRDYTHFDAGYFGVSQTEALFMEPMTRMVLECTHEAIVDAGHNLSDFKGKKVGVYVGVSTFESEQVFYTRDDLEGTFCIVESVRSVISGRVQYFLRTNGEAVVGDAACASSQVCLDRAFKLMQHEDYDYVVLVGCNLCLNHVITVQFARLGVLSKDGVCRSFDDSANGYVRSEGIGVLILEKGRTAKRAYCEIIYTKVNSDGYKSQGITFPSRESQYNLLIDAYNECGIDPATVTYVEAHGTGTHVGDPEELNTITDVFCKGRNKPLYIGSVKSNIGHNEPVSGICGLAKVIIGFHAGLMPPNVNYKSPRKSVQGLMDGRLVVVTEPTPWPDNKCLVGLSSFGFGGSNAHIIVQRYNRHKTNGGVPLDDLPRLVCVSARTERTLTNIFDDFGKRQLDAEYVALYHGIYRRPNAEDLHRGYIVLSKDRAPIAAVRTFVVPNEIAVYFGGEDARLARSLKDLQVFDPFAATIRTAIDYLRSIDNQSTVDIVNEFDERNRLHLIVGSVIAQIALCDTLKLLNAGVKETIGSGIGMLAMYYARGELSVTEALTLAYWHARGAYDRVKELAKRKRFAIELLNGLQSRKSHKSATIRSEPLVIYGTPSHGLPDDYLHGFQSIRDGSFVYEFLHHLGEIFAMGCNLDLAVLYPKITFPVTLQTPMISSLHTWIHKRVYKTQWYNDSEMPRDKLMVIDVNDLEWSFVQGHTIDGRNLFPATGYLYLIWKHFATISYSAPKNFSLLFTNVQFIRAVTVPKEGEVSLHFHILQSGEFAITENGVLMVSGKVKVNDKKLAAHERLDKLQIGEELELKTKDVYKELRLRGYNYSGLFKGIKECSVDGSRAKVDWHDNWIAFLDNLLQVLIIKKDTRDLYVPVGIDYMSIDMDTHYKCVEFNTQMNKTGGSNVPTLPVLVDYNGDVIRSGGVQISGLRATAITRRKPRSEPVLESYNFLPNVIITSPLTIEESTRANVQLILENVNTVKVKVAELLDDERDESVQPLSSYILNALEDLPLIQPDVTIFTGAAITLDNVVVDAGPFNVDENYLLIVGNGLIKRQKFLKELAAVIKPNTYVISRERTATGDRDRAPNGLEILTVHATADERIVLMQKPNEPSKPIVIALDGDIDDFAWLPHLQKAVQQSSDRDVIVYSHARPLNGVLGLVNCLRKEGEGRRVKCMLLDETAPEFDLSHPVYADQLRKDLAINVYKNGTWGTYRHKLLDRNLPKKESNCSFVNTKCVGDLSSLTWFEKLKPENDLAVTVHYSALNFKDVMIASGRIILDDLSRLDRQCELGIEYSGTDRTGRRVMGFGVCGAIATEIVADRVNTWNVPDGWSLADAATVPCVYATSLYALLVAGRLKRNESILIHAGTGGVGQAAINIALHYGCDVFTTVGTVEKKEFVLKHFAGVKESHIGNSRDTSFEAMIRKETNGRGVDLVLNSLAEDKLLASVRCLAAGGRFLEIGKFDCINNNRLPLQLLDDGKVYTGVMIDRLYASDDKEKASLHRLVQRALDDGIVKPLISTVFDYNDVESAFRYMAAGKHVGKVLLNIRKETGPERLPLSTPRFYGRPNRCSVIVGGLGGFGLELADWLVLRGVEKLILTSRTGIANGYQRYRINTWKRYGVTVQVRTDDITTRAGCSSLVEAANRLGPIDSLFNLAVVLRDKTLINQTVDDFGTSLAPKAFATRYLDEITRRHCPQLKHFVVFSSVSCGRGNGGQTNYGMANSIMERICEQRKRDGLPALAIQWGTIGDVGLVADVMDNGNDLVIAGTLQQRISNCLEMMDLLMNQNEPIVASMVVAEKKQSGGNNMIETVANILGIRDLKTVSPHTKLPEMGMDSMMGVEIKQTLERDYEVFLTPQDIRDLTFARLKEISEETDPSTVSQKEVKAKQGLELLFRFAIDEADIGNLVVDMSTASKRHDSPTVYFLPGYEGTHKSFEGLAKKLTTVNAVAFQYSIEKTEQETIADMARNILPDMLKSLGAKRRFAMIAHSFGALVALELASMLEELGYSGKLILIDGSPVLMKAFVEQQFQDQPLNEVEISLLFKLLTYMFTLEEFYHFKDELAKRELYDDKVNYLIENLPNNIEYSRRYQRLLALSLYNRLLAMKSYRPSFSRIRSPIYMYKAKIDTVQTIVEEDHGLSRLCQQEVHVKLFDGDHVTILDNDDLATEITNLIGNEGRSNEKRSTFEIDRCNGITNELRQ